MKPKSTGPKFSAIYLWEMDTPAYRCMSAWGRSLLIEFRGKYNTHNNGEIAMSVLDAARLLGCHKDTAFKALRELEEKGWIREEQKGSFHWKTDATGRKFRPATTYRITNQPVGLGVDIKATKEYMKWRPEI